MNEQFGTRFLYSPVCTFPTKIHTIHTSLSTSFDYCIVQWVSKKTTKINTSCAYTCNISRNSCLEAKFEIIFHLLPIYHNFKYQKWSYTQRSKIGKIVQWNKCFFRKSNIYSSFWNLKRKLIKIKLFLKTIESCV